jgi:hypothetical protein
MNRIAAFKVLEDYQIWLQFQNGESKIVDFTTLIGKGVSAPLLDKEYFKKVTIESGGGLAWPNGMDFCPNFLKEFTSDLVVSR